MKTFIIAVLILASSSVFAQTPRPRDSLGVPGGIIHAPTSLIAPSQEDTVDSTLQKLRAKFNADVAADLTGALTLANTKDAAGNIADTTAAPCYQALLNLNGVIASYTPPQEKPHVISDFEQLRIIRRTLQSIPFRDACSPLIQDMQTQAAQLLTQIFSIVGGLAKFGILVP